MQEFIRTVSVYLKQIYDLKITPYIIAAIAFGFIMVIALVVKPGKQLGTIYVKINDRLIRKTKKKSFDYEKIKKSLSRSGMLYKHAWLENPAAYIGLKVILSLLFGVFVSFFHPLLIPLGLVFGYKSFDLYMYLSNNSDNKKMQKDIELIFNLLSIQVRSGVYMPSALCECVDVIDPSDLRLKTALMQLSGNLIIGTPFKDAIRSFNENFDNQHIDSLCTILDQASESGKSEDLLADIGKQVKLFTALQMDKKKQEMDLSMTIVILGLFVDIMYVILDLSINTIMVQMTNF